MMADSLSSLRAALRASYVVVVPRSIRQFNEPLNMHDTWLKCVITSEW